MENAKDIPSATAYHKNRYILISLLEVLFYEHLTWHIFYYMSLTVVLYIENTTHSKSIEGIRSCTAKEMTPGICFPIKDEYTP